MKVRELREMLQFLNPENNLIIKHEPSGIRYEIRLARDVSGTSDTVIILEQPPKKVSYRPAIERYNGEHKDLVVMIWDKEKLGRIL